jgi:hypothetical protein
LPLLLIILGVIGGLLAFGVLSLFLGPLILAVISTLLQHWVAEAKHLGLKTSMPITSRPTVVPVVGRWSRRTPARVMPP